MNRKKTSRRSPFSLVAHGHLWPLRFGDCVVAAVAGRFHSIIYADNQKSKPPITKAVQRLANVAQCEPGSAVNLHIYPMSQSPNWRPEAAVSAGHFPDDTHIIGSSWLNEIQLIN